MEELHKQNEDLSTKFSIMEAKCAQTSNKDKPSSSTTTPRTSSLDLHWNEEGKMDEMSEDEYPIVKANWRFQREHFKELTHVATTLNHYEAVVGKIDRYMYPSQLELVDLIVLNAPLLKSKIKATCGKI